MLRFFVSGLVTPEIRRRIVGRRALDLMQGVRAEFAAYEEDVEHWYRYGDGRPTSKGGRGFAYPTCVHGTSTWVDFDCACWRCESEGGYFSYLTQLRVALEDAEFEVERFEKSVTAFMLLQGLSMSESLESELRQLLDAESKKFRLV